MGAMSVSLSGSLGTEGERHVLSPAVTGGDNQLL